MQQISPSIQKQSLFFYKNPAYLFVFSILFLIFPTRAEAEIASPFPRVVEMTVPLSKEESGGAGYKCQKPLAAPKNLHFESIYEEEDPSRSRIDEYRYDIYQKKSAELSDFENKVSKMANITSGRGEHYLEAADCASRWLYLWAKEGALLGDVNKGGVAVRKWSLASLSSSYAQIKDIPSLNKKRKARIEKWLNAVANEVIEDYSTNLDEKSRNNNHIYWAAWSVAITSYILQDTRMWNWAMDRAAEGINQIQPDGTLPLEMQRGSRALLYHVFAAAPLVMMAEMGRRNGKDLYGRKDGGLHRLVARVLDGTDTPSYFQQRTGHRQDYREIDDANGFAWLLVYNYRFTSKQVEQKLSDIDGAMFNRRLGGDMRVLFPPDN